MNARFESHISMRGLAAALVTAMLVGVAPVQAQSGSSTGTVLREGVPDTYVVRKGDTLWDISARFLRDPWLWPEVWQANPEIENPHLIYPGDIIRLMMVDGRPRLVLDRGGRGYSGPDRLQPRVREIPLEEAIHTIPLDAIRPFLSRPMVVSEHELDGAPYIMRATDGRLMSGQGHRFYARGFTGEPSRNWTIVRKGQEYKDPVTGDTLGYEAQYIGDARIERLGDPATLVMTASRQEARTGDRLIDYSVQDLDRGLQPRAPDTQVEGSVVAQVGGADQIGRFSVIALNRGAVHGLEPGVVVSIWRAGKTVRDTAVDRGVFSANERVQLPDERYGEAIVFRAYDTMSFALVMRSSRELAVGDVIRNP